MSNTNQKSCFIIMPISDPSDYEVGHFKRVYEHLIRPACESSNLKPIRADEVKSANHIVLDILQRIVTADLVICDLSSKNANVMYELGVRQAFDLPVVLVKDQRTDRVFDIQGLRSVDYDEKLRVDCVNNDVENLRAAIEATISPDRNDVNSLVKLLGINSAELPKNNPISNEAALILASLQDISKRIASIELFRSESDLFGGVSGRNRRLGRAPRIYSLPSGEEVSTGEEIFDSIGGNLLGKFVAINSEGVTIQKSDGTHFVVPPDQEVFKTLSTIPF